jgi:hypothetical protein
LRPFGFGFRVRFCDVGMIISIESKEGDFSPGEGSR